MNKDLIFIGKILKSHGLAGEFKVYPLSEDIFFYDRKYVYIIKDNKEQSLFSEEPMLIDYVKGDRSRPIFHIKGIDSLEAVKNILQCYLAADREILPPLEEDEYYFADLAGMKAFLDNGDYLGEVREVFETLKQEVISVINEGKEYLIPFVKQWVKDVDTEKNTMIIDHRFLSDEED